MKKDLAYYKRLRWERDVKRNDDETGQYWVACYTDLPDVVGTGATREEAILMHTEMFDEFVQHQIELGHEIKGPPAVGVSKSDRELSLPDRISSPDAIVYAPADAEFGSSGPAWDSGKLVGA